MFGFHTRSIISLLWLSSCTQASVLFLNSAVKGIAYSIVEHAREGVFPLSGAVKVLASYHVMEVWVPEDGPKQGTAA